MSSASTEPTSAYASADRSAVGAAGACRPASQDAEAIRKTLAGDRSAFASVVLAWQDRLYNVLRKMTRNEEDAADLTQETFARALDNLRSFRGESSAYTWLFRIALNLATSQHRQRLRRRTNAASQLGQPADAGDASANRVFDARPGPTDAPAAHLENAERNQQVLAALQRLPDDQRALLVLRDVEDMDYQQIADTLDVPLGTLKSRLFRARLALREQLKGYFPPPQ